MNLKVVKRDGRVVDYDGRRIKRAITRAAVGTGEELLPAEISEIEEYIFKICSDRGQMTVEEIQDHVELLLMRYAPAVARSYILYREERAAKREIGWELTELQADIYENKYRHRDESFKEFLNRVSGNNLEVRKLIECQRFLFAGRILAGRGLSHLGRNVTLSNCYVLPQPEDNIESIFDVSKYMARTYSYGGGVGTDLSLLRPKGYPVNNASKTTTGPVSFMKIYDTTTGVIGQKNRRGALMLSMHTSHPDILEFIHSKDNIEELTNTNISVRTDGELFEEENREILEELALSNWRSGEPGVLYWDRVESWHLLSEHPEYKLKATNPCGEQPLPPFGNCLLGSINLSEYVIKPYTDESKIDIEKLREDIKTAVIGLNEVLEEGIPLHPLQQQRDMAEQYRQIGLGIMGLADLFIKLGVTYGSEESLRISDTLGKLFRDTAIEQSIELAKEYGPYPKFNAKIVSRSPYFKSLPQKLQDDILKYGMRNSHVLSIAPTGSISTMIGVSGGIEPIFANSYTRTTKSLGQEDITYKVYTETIKELMDVKGIKREEDLPEYCVTSHEINPFDRVKVQSIWQKYVDSAISSTINLHEETPPEVIADLYKYGYEKKLKGLTVFRDNCFRTGILSTDKKETKQKDFTCPECGEDLNMSEGCNECPSCGWGQCSI